MAKNKKKKEVKETNYQRVLRQLDEDLRIYESEGFDDQAERITDAINLIKTQDSTVVAYTNRLNMLKAYFRDYGLLEHYMAWVKSKVEKKAKKALTLVEK